MAARELPPLPSQGLVGMTLPQLDSSDNVVNVDDSVDLEDDDLSLAMYLNDRTTPAAMPPAGENAGSSSPAQAALPHESSLQQAPMGLGSIESTQASAANGKGGKA